MRLLPIDIDPQEFYKSKYLFYHRFTFWVAIIASFCMVTYFVSDCQIFGYTAWEVLPMRLFPLVIAAGLAILSRKTTNYKIMTVATYLTVLSVLWCTIWVVYYLPDKTHFGEGSVINQFLFFAVGFAAPWHYVVAVSGIVLVSILGTDCIIHYPNFDILISLNLPCLIGTTVAHFFMQKLYIKHFRAQKMLEYISMYDQLTGANSRNAIQNLIKVENNQFIDDLTRPLCVAMFDIDFFKAVNDNYGHAKGDIVLKDFTTIVKKNMRQGDYFIRWGGEEFVLLMPNTSIKHAMSLVEGIRKKVSQAKSKVCPITISAGVSRYDGMDYKKAIDQADQALYKAKAAGRNNVVLFEE